MVEHFNLIQSILSSPFPILACVSLCLIVLWHIAGFVGLGHMFWLWLHRCVSRTVMRASGWWVFWDVCDFVSGSDCPLYQYQRNRVCLLWVPKPAFRQFVTNSFGWDSDTVTSLKSRKLFCSLVVVLSCFVTLCLRFLNFLQVPETDSRCSRLLELGSSVLICLLMDLRARLEMKPCVFVLRNFSME